MIFREEKLTMPNFETPSELADHLADLLGLSKDVKCEVIGWNNPPDFIGPIPEHIQNCDCRVFWILEMTNRIRRAVVNEITSDLRAFKPKSIYMPDPDTLKGKRFTGRLTSNKSNLRSVDTSGVTGRLVDKGPELQDPRGLDIESPKDRVEHNKYFDLDYGEIEASILASVPRRDRAIYENFLGMYGPKDKYPMDKELVDISAKYIDKSNRPTEFVHKSGLGFNLGDKVEEIKTGIIGIVISEESAAYTIGIDEVMVVHSKEERDCWMVEDIRKIE